MKSLPKFDSPSVVSSVKNPDIDIMSHEQLGDLDKDIEKKLSKQIQQINSSVDKENASINTIYAGAIDKALMQISDYFTSIQLEESEIAKNTQYIIQSPPQISTPSEASVKEIKYNIKLARDMQNNLSKRAKEEAEKREELKKKRHI